MPSTGRNTSQDHIKANGVHYTPPALASFLADAVAKTIRHRGGRLRVLDPACGDGELLLAFANALPTALRGHLVLEGYEKDDAAIARAERALAHVGAHEIVLKHEDFLSEEVVGHCLLDAQQNLFSADNGQDIPLYDVAIANPPYVRTQVLGAKASQSLAKRFRLSGRVDLYHAFVMGMANVLKRDGTLGLLTSNRFLTVKSGASLRRLLRTAFHLEAIYDLGDTKLFSAAVLPAILIARKGSPEGTGMCHFDRVYEHRCQGGDTIRGEQHHTSILTALRDRAVQGLVHTAAGTFHMERGTLVVHGDAWSLSTARVEEWLQTVRKHTTHRFGDLSKVRVGIKTTADEVFIRDDWNHLPIEKRPEEHLLRPLLTHSNAARWRPQLTATLRRVLYPHTVVDGRRSAVNLAENPRGAAYLKSHEERLMRRSYVIDAGRQWYEIWVPQNPDDWRKPKIVFPDIAEYPRFFLDRSGAVVNGDCYWITLNRGVDTDWLLLMLAVANSTFITKYYDTLFHNKLYAGRRRFMTQYVANFPLPDINSPAGRRIVSVVRTLVNDDTTDANAERDVDALVCAAFASVEEVRREVHL